MIQEVQTWADVQRRLSAIAIERHPRSGAGPNLDRIRTLLERLGNPQNQLRVIHVAGTSGKGSTATTIAHLLSAFGWRVGLHVSPHVNDVRERMQIDGALVSSDVLLPIFQDVLAVADGSSFFEILVAASYLLFARQDVDYAVIETGMGGRWDATNTVDRADKIAVITRLGLDHTKYLGTTLAQIAGEKIGIVQPGNRVFSVWQSAAARAVIDQACAAQHAELTYLRAGSAFRQVRVTPQGTSFWIPAFAGTTSGALTTSLIGRHQAENVSLALSVVEEICRREQRPFDEVTVRSALKTLSIPGRCEVRTIEGRTVIFDVAHNPQKMRSLIRTLHEAWPNQRPVFLIAFGVGSNHAEMLRLIAKEAAGIVLTDFSVKDAEYEFRFADPAKLAAILEKQSYVSQQILLDDPQAALRAAFSYGSGPIVITGYFHYVAAMSRYFPAQTD